MRTVGFNVEWSQELTLEQSLEEYVKASMLIEMLAASGRLELSPGFERFAFDLSVGYDFAASRATTCRRSSAACATRGRRRPPAARDPGGMARYSRTCRSPRAWRRA
jgi:hypothetical protein